MFTLRQISKNFAKTFANDLLGTLVQVQRVQVHPLNFPALLTVAWIYVSDK